jgi:hypothetical protein
MSPAADGGLAVLSEFHRLLANSIWLFFLLLGLWGLIRSFRQQPVDGSYFGALVIGELIFLLQGLLGAILYFTGARPARDWQHILYGIFALVFLPGLFTYPRATTPIAPSGSTPSAPCSSSASPCARLQLESEPAAQALLIKRAFSLSAKPVLCSRHSRGRLGRLRSGPFFRPHRLVIGQQIFGVANGRDEEADQSDQGHQDPGKDKD